MPDVSSKYAQCAESIVSYINSIPMNWIDIINVFDIHGVKGICDSAMKKLPTNEWIDIQTKYIFSLSDQDKYYVNLYTMKGDGALNSYIRANNQVTDNIIRHIKQESDFWSQEFGNEAPDRNRINEFLEKFYKI